jgi:hypothetical protein
MADASKKEAMTNTTPKSCVEVNCDCNTMWSLAQQFSTTRLSVKTGENEGELIEDYAVRARRIAATYARFYLELEDGCDEKKLGRYYWMALGAFASKTVACAFDSLQIKMMTPISHTVHEGLGKGNFWLFCDISGWHWYHSNYPSSFFTCIHQRHANNYTIAVKRQMEFLPWKKKSLPIIKYFSPSKEIKDGFALVTEIEKSTDLETIQDLQLEHLLTIANHEQGVILQPLIYDDIAFATWVQRQRAWYAHWASPALELVFTHECSTKHLNVKSVAPNDIELERFLSRMAWIKSAASQFHGLMIMRKGFMHSALGIMAGWVDLSDTVIPQSGAPI